jgi:pimeloyl-ACP methyl ester carboxylesterase
MSLRLAYLHGFASSPASRKARVLGERLAARGLTLHVPDLRRPSFPRLSHDAMLAAVDALDAETKTASSSSSVAGDDDRWVLVGSSLGGHVTSLWATQNPGRVRALLLLCPAFDVPTRWRSMRGAEAMARWERDGFLPHADDQGVPQPLHWGFFAEACRHDPRPQPEAPTVVVHGTKDTVVPLSSSEAFVAAAPDRRRLVVVDDDHELGASLDVIERELWSLLVEPAASR